MPRKPTKSKKEKLDKIESLSVLEDNERQNAVRTHITVNRRTLLETGKKLEKICEGLKDPTHFDDYILELEKLKDDYMRVGSGRM